VGIMWSVYTPKSKAAYWATGLAALLLMVELVMGSIR